MHKGGGYFAEYNRVRKKARHPAALPLALFFFSLTLFEWVWAPGKVWPWGGLLPEVGIGWTDYCSFSWLQVREGGEWWRMFFYCAAPHSLWHGLLGAAGLYVAARAVEPIVGTWQMLVAALLGTLVGALTSWGVNALVVLAQNQTILGTGTTPGEVLANSPPLQGTLPMLATLVGIYSTILPGWRIGAASCLRTVLPLTAGGFGWLSAMGCALWWAFGWFPEAGPASMLGGLLFGWGFARLLGFGDFLFVPGSPNRKELEFRQLEEMGWEEFLQTHLNPVLEKISLQGIKSLTRGEWRILQQSRRKLEGW